MFQLFIDILARALFLHDRVSRNFYWTVTFVPEEDLLDGMCVDGVVVNGSDTRSRNSQTFPMKEKSPSKDCVMNMHGSEDKDLELTGADSMLMLKKNVFSPSKGENKNIAILKLQWMSIALVLDRLFFLIYLITLTISWIILFPKAPVHEETS